MAEPAAVASSRGGLPARLKAAKQSGRQCRQGYTKLAAPLYSEPHAPNEQRKFSETSFHAHTTRQAGEGAERSTRLQRCVLPRCTAAAGHPHAVLARRSSRPLISADHHTTERGSSDFGAPLEQPPSFATNPPGPG